MGDNAEEQKPFPLVLLQAKAVRVDGELEVDGEHLCQVSISSPSGEGGEYYSPQKADEALLEVSISSPSGEGGERYGVSQNATRRLCFH